MFTKSGLNRVLLSKLTIFENFEEAIKQDSIDVLILDGLTQVLETSDNGIRDFVNILLKSQAISNSLILRTELDCDILEEKKIFDYVHKKADLLLVTKAISFISNEIHGRLIIRDSDENVYERFYFIKDRSLNLKNVGVM